MTYTELVTFVNDICENSFPTVDMNMFIEQAEQKIYNTVQLASLRKNVTGNLTTANPYLSLPTDWLATYSIAVIDSSGNYYYLLNKDVNFLREAFRTPSSTGTPYCYALFGPQEAWSSMIPVGRRRIVKTRDGRSRGAA